MIVTKKPLYINIVVASILILTCFLFYGTTLRNQYNLDDNYVIVNQPLTNKGIKAIPQIFTSNYINKTEESHSYRPLTLTSFAIEYEFFEATPFVSHLINVLLYCLCCFLVFKLVLYLQFENKNYILAISTALVFLILPVHSEVVNNVKCRDELLSFCFALSACIQFLKFGRTKSYKFIFFGTLLLVLSLLSKLTSLPLLAIVPLMLTLFSNVKKKHTLGIAGLLIGSFIALRFIKKGLVQNTHITREIKNFENPLFDKTAYSFTDRIPVAISTFGEYIRLLIYPKDLISYYGYNQFEIATWSDIWVWHILLLVIGIIVGIIKLWKKRPILVFGFLWLFITLSMFTNLIKPVVGIIGERFAFLPSFGFAIIVSYALMYLSKTNLFRKSIPRLGMVTVLGVILFFNVNKVMDRNANWYDFKTLSKNDVMVATDSAKLHALLANQLFREIRQENDAIKRDKLILETLALYRRCVEIYPGYYKSWNNMGTLVLNEYSDYELAITYYENAIFYKSDYKDALFGAGYSNEILGNKDQALNYYGQLMAVDPNHLNVTGRILQLQNE